MKLASLESALGELLDAGAGGPVVVFAALWPFLRVLDLPPADAPQAFLNVLLGVLGPGRSLLMPTFTGGYSGGVCDLDREPSQNGLLSETLRCFPGCRRSLSAFFSFGIVGPEAEEFAVLRPEFAWGEGSAYAWMEERNASFLMLGTHPTHCSYLHRLEWLAKDVVRYRSLKTFSGTILRDGRRHPMTETLFVRGLRPEAVNDFTPAQGALLGGGMRTASLEGVALAHMRAADMKAAALPLILEDPLVFVKNAEDFKREEKTP